MCEEFTFCEKRKFILVLILVNMVTVEILPSTEQYKEELKVTRNSTAHTAHADTQEVPPRLLLPPWLVWAGYLGGQSTCPRATKGIPHSR